MPQAALRPTVMEEMSNYFDLTVVEVERCWVDVALSISGFCLQDWFGFRGRNWTCLIGYVERSIGHCKRETDFDDTELKEFCRVNSGEQEIKETRFGMFRKGLLEWLAF
mmetsp:Transcript_31071/g.47460  ORF Transcript_31071/g.47460 Transcript_31071/m.47460 type:complete len:109 (-) Transcript_31071:253-579(-)